MALSEQDFFVTPSGKRINNATGNVVDDSYSGWLDDLNKQDIGSALDASRTGTDLVSQSLAKGFSSSMLEDEALFQEEAKKQSETARAKRRELINQRFDV